MKTKIEVEVEIDAAGNVATVSIGAGAPYALPLDKPMPRKFAKDFAEAAALSIRASGNDGRKGGADATE